MARQPRLRDKGGYWYSEAGGKARRYGKVGVVSFDEALRAFHADQAARPVNPADNPAPPDVATIDLVSGFLNWVLEHRGAKAFEHRQLHLLRWADHFGHLRPARQASKNDMDGFLAGLKAKGYAADYLRKHFVSVNAMYTWAAKNGRVPAVKPFAAVEKVRVPHRPITEHDLPTPEEFAKLFEFADADFGPFLVPFKGSRRRTREEWRAGDDNPYRGFRDMLVVYHGTGARTYELCEVLVGDYQPRGRQLLLAAHKTMYAQRKPRARQITPTEAACEVLERLCHGREKFESIFWWYRANKPWDPHSVAERFQKVRKLAGVRDSLTVYSFRHLFISQLLQAGVDVFRVAKMSGNSVDVIESTYGHLRTEDFRAAVKRLEELRRV